MGFIQPLRPSLQFSHSIVSNSLRPHGLQHTRPPCLSPIPSFLKLMSIKSVMPSNHLNLCHPLLLPPSIFPSIKVFFNKWALQIRWPKFGVSASVLPMDIQGWLPLGLTGLISLLSKGLSRVFSSTTVWKHQFFGTQPSLWSNSLIHTWLLGKLWLWLYGPLLTKWCLCFLIHCLCLS